MAARRETPTQRAAGRRFPFRFMRMRAPGASVKLAAESTRRFVRRNAAPSEGARSPGDSGACASSPSSPRTVETMSIAHDRILILDFGSQVTQLIARRVREAHVYCEVHPNDVSAEFIRDFKPNGIILSGSHMSAYEESNDQASEAVFKAGVPVLGICYGMQTMAQQLGGKVESGAKREFGYAEVRVEPGSRLLDGIEDFKSDAGDSMMKVWMSHGDKVTALPPGARMPGCPPT